LCRRSPPAGGVALRPAPRSRPDGNPAPPAGRTTPLLTLNEVCVLPRSHPLASKPALRSGRFPR
jgi:hypothetical protein